MRISKIYSNNELMTPIRFNRGFNVIYGDIENKNGEKNEHNLGKSSLVYLIDFLLLKKVTQEHFLSRHKEQFVGWTFYIEIELGENHFLTIKRSVNNPTRISFKKHDTKDQDFSSLELWDHEDTKLYARNGMDSQDILDKYLNFSILKNYSYRHFLPYALSDQYGYEDVFEMSQFQGLDINWKPYLFALLGYKEEDVINKYLVYDQINSYRKMLNIILGNKKINTRDSYNLKEAINEKENEKKSIIEQADKFDFYLREKKLSKELVNDIEIKISELNSERYRLDYEI